MVNKPQSFSQGQRDEVKQILRKKALSWIIEQQESLFPVWLLCVASTNTMN